MTRLARRRTVVASVVVLAVGAAVGSSTAASTGTGPAHQSPPAAPAQPGVAPPGVELSPEVAAVPASSPELDAAEDELAAAGRERDEQAAELAALDDRVVRDTAELAAVSSMAERRGQQVQKAAAAEDRSRRALAAVTLERFIEGDHLLEGLDPALTADRREELGRQVVLGAVGTEDLLRERRHTTGRLDELTAERDGLVARRDDLERALARAGERRVELDAELVRSAERIDSAETAVREARLAASVDGTDLSTLALDAYWRAARRAALTDPSCAVSWSVLAGIGRTESRHGTYRDATVGPDGVVSPPIYGPDLDGSNEFAVVPDSDGGSLDATSRTDRAVGPMQFLPGTWRTVGTDQTGDGNADPQNLFDAAASAAVYLCRSGPGLDDPARRRAAILTYNRSQEYADIVEQRATEYAAAVPLR